MRILHFMNTPLDTEAVLSSGRHINSGGGWMAMIIRRLLSDTDHQVACAALGTVATIGHSGVDRLDCFVVPRGRDENANGLQACRDVVAAWRPDLIHIHGTEGPFGLLSARRMINCPAIISLQGLLGPCSEWYRYFGNRSMRDIVHMHRLPELFLQRGLLAGFRNIRKNARREQLIIAGNSYFMGRTDWDRAYLRALNPSAKYYPAGELLREPFWQKRWSIEGMQRHRLIFTNARHPRKGTEVLLDAVKMLAPDYPDIKVTLVGGLSQGSGYGRYLRGKMQKLGDIVDELGAMNAEQMADELLKANVFVHPSFIDNSPNSVGEAQLLGMPVIASYTGGVPSLIEEGHTGMFVPTGDAFLLAARIRELFENDDLAVRLGRAAHNAAACRYAPDAIMRGTVAAYEDVCKRSTKCLAV